MRLAEGLDRRPGGEGRVFIRRGHNLSTRGGSVAAPRRRRAPGLLAALALALSVSACSGDPPSILEPKGPGAERVEGLWWPMLWISTAVFLVVLAFLVVAVFKARRKDAKPDDRARWGEPFIVVAGVIVPALILAAVFLFSLREMNALSAEGEDANLTIEVFGRMWWWEARYPNGAVTANEIHIPVGEPVRLKLATRDVLHSFWVPQLQVKTDMINDQVNEMWLEADEPGRYRGLCAEFCGLQHANMLFYVVAEQPDAFQAWLDNEARPAVEPAGATESQGREVFLNSTCAGCHAIRGTDAVSERGPDLTHLARRETIAAGILPNDRENLTRFIVNPQDVKPGAIMPPTDLSGEELEALLDYLQSLE